MKKITVFIIIQIIFVNLILAQLIKFDFNTDPYINASIVNSNLIVSDIALSNGTIGTGETVGDYFTDEPFIEETGGWAINNLTDAKYFYIDISALPGQQFSITDIGFESYVTGAGPSAISILLNDTEVYTLDMPDGALQTINQPITGYTDLSSLNIKIAGWDNSSRSTTGSGDFRMDNLIISGTTSAIPPKDSTSSITLLPASVPTTISSLTNTANGLKIMDIVIADSASGDGVNTIIDEIIFTTGTNNQIPDWNKIIDGALLTGTRLGDGVNASIRTDSLIFNTNNLIEVLEGIGNEETYSLNIWLNDTLNEIDSKQFEFYTDSSLINCNANGSIVNYGEAASGNYKLIVDVLATEMTAIISNSILRTDSVFNIDIYATDANGNIDADYSGSATLSVISNTGELNSGTGFTGSFTNGFLQFSNLTFNGTDTIVFKITSNELSDYQCEPIIIGKHFFNDNFELNTLAQWSNSDDWTSSEIEPIDGKHSLKHNLVDTSASSFIAAKHLNQNFNDGTTVWRLLLKNGNFDPTSSNKFWYYIMASADSLTQEEIYGYAVGVNFENSTDSLSLWRIDGDGDKTLIIQSELDWDEDTLIAIEVIREVPGIWKLGFGSSTKFNNLTYTSSKTDEYYSIGGNHGLVFNYTTSRAGLLKADNLNFFQINTAPMLISVEANSRSQVALSFSETINQTEAELLSSYTINSDTDLGIALESVTYNPEYPNQVILNLNQLNTTNYIITTKNLKDTDGAVMETQSIEFYYQVPAEAFDIVITEIMSDPTPSVGLPEYDYLEIYNRSDNPFYLNNWIIEIGGVEKILPDSIINTNEYIIITSSSGIDELSILGKTIGIISSTALTNTGKPIRLISKEGLQIDSIFYTQSWYKNEDKENGGWSLEKIDIDNTCSGKLNWKACENSLGGTPGLTNSVNNINTDSISATISYFRLLNSSEILLEFSEEVNATTLVKENFKIENETIDNISILNNENSQIKLTLSPSLTFGESYSLSINNIADLCSNISQAVSISFAYNFIEQNDIVISELMVDPSPVIGLPDFEYIEITNVSEKTIQLENWRIEVNGSSKTLPRKELSPNEIIALCSESAYSELIEFGNSLAVQSFPSLTNTSGTIQLLDTANNIINTVQYSSSWYKNEDKDNGGWSLEKIDPNNHCLQKDNWLSSENLTGGTPGLINSVNGIMIDNSSPIVKSAAPISNKEIWIEYSEPINQVIIGNMENYELIGLNQAYTFNIDSNNYSNLVLNLQNPLKTDSTYTLKIRNIADNCNNILKDTTLTFSYTEVEIYDIVINEIMASPTPAAGLPEAEYIELYNNSGKDIHLYNWSVSVGNSERLLPYIFFSKDSYLIICKSEYAESMEQYGKVVSVDDLPALPSSGYIIISNNIKLTVCITPYTNDWINDDYKKEGGYSIERIDYNNLNESEYNWLVTQNEIGGTPGTKNSVYKDNPDNESFHLTKAVPLTEKVILATFNKPVAPNSLQNENFSVDNKIGIPSNIDAIPPFYNSILLLFLDSLQNNINYTFKVNDTFTDISGNTIKNNTDVFMLPKPAQENSIIINEILFNPNDEGVDFIELYNKTDYSVNMSQLFIATRSDDYIIKTPNEITYEGEIILPGEYKVVSTNSKKIKEQYIIENEFAFIDASKMISLANSEGTIVILDTNGIVIDEFTYNESMHFGLLDDTKGISLERINHEQTTQEAGNWHSASEQSGWATPGYENSVHMEISEHTEPITIEPEAFSPDNDGYNDIVNFHYNFSGPGKVANVTIMNTKGQIIRNLVNNELLAQSGLFVWDGLTDEQDKALIGIYIVLFEIFDAEGNVKNYKKTCVVATKL